MASRRADKGKAIASSSTPSKRARSSSGLQAQRFDGTLFRNLKASEDFYSDFRSRKILSGKRIDFAYFSNAGVNLISIFEKVGWLAYVSINEIVYPRLVALFYANLEEDEDHRLTTYVKGVPIRLKWSLFSDVMEIPKDPAVQCVDRLSHRYEALNQLLGVEIESYDTARVNANLFPAYHRFLHKLVCSIFLPRSGSMEGVTDDHILLIKALLDGSNNVDLVNLTMSSIRDVIVVPKRSLLYGMLITRILKKFKVNFAGEEASPLTNYEVIDGSTLSRMKMTIQNGVFIRTRTGTTPQKEQSSMAKEKDNEDYVMHNPSASRIPPQVDHIAEMFTKLGTDMNAQFASLGTRFGSLETKVDSLKTEVYLLTKSQERNEEIFRAIGSCQNVMLDNHMDVKKELWDSFYQGPPPSSS